MTTNIKRASFLRTARVLALALLAGVVVGDTACRGTPQISFDVSLPESLVASTAWFEVGAFRDGSCSALRPMLAEGIPDGATQRVAFKSSDSTTPPLGTLPRGTYAFGAVARGKDCEVLAAGCVPADVTQIGSVLIQLAPTDGKSGACGSGATCQAARCVPAKDNADPSIGAGCSLELVGAGPVANPTGGAGTTVSAPAIIAVPSGFLIVYREVDSSGATARITVLPIDSGGGAGDPVRPGLPNRCADDGNTDGLGLTISSTNVLVGISRPVCGAKAALEVLNVSVPAADAAPADKNKAAIGEYDVAESQNTLPVRLSPSHPTATRPGEDVIVYVEGETARIAKMTTKGFEGPSSPSAPYAGSFGGAINGTTGAWVAATDKVLALLALGTGSNPVGVPDAGGPAPDAGDDSGVPPPPPPPIDSGVNSTLRLVMVPPSTPLTGFDATQNLPKAPITFRGAWASMAATGGRVIVLSDSGGTSRSVSFRTFDLGNDDQPVLTSSYPTDGEGDVSTGDVAISGDRAFFATLKNASIELNAFANASTTPTKLRGVIFANEPRIPSVANVRQGGKIAVTATDSRVAVVWTTAASLNLNDPTGGYAVFACTP